MLPLFSFLPDKVSCPRGKGGQLGQGSRGLGPPARSTTGVPLGVTTAMFNQPIICCGGFQSWWSSQTTSAGLDGTLPGDGPWGASQSHRIGEEGRKKDPEPGVSDGS